MAQTEADLRSPCCPDSKGVYEIIDTSDLWGNPTPDDGDGPPHFSTHLDTLDDSDHNSYSCRRCGNDLLWDRMEKKFVVDDGTINEDLVLFGSPPKLRYER